MAAEIGEFVASVFAHAMDSPEDLVGAVGLVLACAAVLVAFVLCVVAPLVRSCASACGRPCLCASDRAAAAALADMDANRSGHLHVELVSTSSAGAVTTTDQTSQTVTPTATSTRRRSPLQFTVTTGGAQAQAQEKPPQPPTSPATESSDDDDDLPPPPPPLTRSVARGPINASVWTLDAMGGADDLLDSPTWTPTLRGTHADLLKANAAPPLPLPSHLRKPDDGSDGDGSSDAYSQDFEDDASDGASSDGAAPTLATAMLSVYTTLCSMLRAHDVLDEHGELGAGLYRDVFVPSLQRKMRMRDVDLDMKTGALTLTMSELQSNGLPTQEKCAVQVTRSEMPVFPQDDVGSELWELLGRHVMVWNSTINDFVEGVISVSRTAWSCAPLLVACSDATVNPSPQQRAAAQQMFPSRTRDLLERLRRGDPTIRLVVHCRSRSPPTLTVPASRFSFEYTDDDDATLPLPSTSAWFTFNDTNVDGAAVAPKPMWLQGEHRDAVVRIWDLAETGAAKTATGARDTTTDEMADDSSLRGDILV